MGQVADLIAGTVAFGGFLFGKPPPAHPDGGAAEPISGPDFVVCAVSHTDHFPGIEFVFLEQFREPVVVGGGAFVYDFVEEGGDAETVDFVFLAYRSAEGDQEEEVARLAEFLEGLDRVGEGSEVLYIFSVVDVFQLRYKGLDGVCFGGVVFSPVFSESAGNDRVYPDTGFWQCRRRRNNRVKRSSKGRVSAPGR